MLLKKSRHPVIEKLLPLSEKFITNDLELKNKQFKIFDNLISKEIANEGAKHHIRYVYGG